MEFIPNHGSFFQGLIPESVCNDLISTTNVRIWDYIKDIVPEKYKGENLVGMGEIEYCRTEPSTLLSKKKRFHPTFYDNFGNASLLTVMIYCNTINDGGDTLFYANPKKHIFFLVYSAENYRTKPIAGNVVIFSHDVGYIEEPVITGKKYVMKIPILYTCSHAISTDCSMKHVTFDNTIKKFEIPTPNEMKFTQIKIRDEYGKDVILSPDLNDRETMKRWAEVENSPKIFRIEKQEIPAFINTKKGRPPTSDEDYCPNCFEILSLNYKIGNCSGCLSDIVIDEELLRYKKQTKF